MVKVDLGQFLEDLKLNDIRGKMWVKKLSSVNWDGKNGYAFEGDFLPRGTAKYNGRRVEYRDVVNWDIQPGDFLLVYAFHGSAKYSESEAVILEVIAIEEDNGFIYQELDRSTGKDWARSLLLSQSFRIAWDNRGKIKIRKAKGVKNEQKKES